MKRTKIFISHSNLDKPKMRALKGAIKKINELDPIVVVETSTPRMLFSEKVKQHLLMSDYVVPIITDNSIYSQWVNQEIGFAEASGIKTFAIVQSSLLRDIKGFIHNQEEQFTFDHNSNHKIESRNFRKAYKLVISHICTLEKITKAYNKNNSDDEDFDSTISTSYEPIDINKDFIIRNNSKFIVKIKLTDVNQKFRVYYRFVTDANERKWIGFTNKLNSTLIIADENSQNLNLPPNTYYEFTDDILKTIANRFPNLNGKPKSVDRIRFRGDQVLSEPIHFFYLLK